jgi:xanthine dehydrogenase YagR molybdenum-binding subunit
MAEYKWPEADKRSLIGKRISRVDGPAKVTGKAKYAYDIKRPGMLYGKILHAPYAHARVVSIDTSVAEKMPGVQAVKIIQGPGTEIQWAGSEIVAVAAVDEPTAEDAIRAIKVEYERLPHFVNEADLAQVPQDRRKPGNEELAGNPDQAFQDPDSVVVEGTYGNSVITHCCLEAHGQIVEWEGENNVLIHPSTQAVSVIGGQLAQALGIPAGNVHLQMDYIGGGFGSKFSIDRWGTECARISKLAGGKPVKIMLDRKAELMVAGTRPSVYARVKVAAKKDGTITAWQSESWGTAGMGGANPLGQLPYIIRQNLANRRLRHIDVPTNTGPSRAWRAPTHPQTCLITMSALDDLAAALKMDPLDFFLKNLELTGSRANVYREELLKAAEMIEWKKNWHPRGETGRGPVKRGLGLSIHTWQGSPHASNCDITIHPDGSVELKMGTQDLGTGTRTVVNIVAAETFGLPLESVKVFIGDNRYPTSGASGGSTTVGGVSSSTRRAAVDALNQLFEKVAPALSAQPDQLEARGGRVFVSTEPSRGMTWQQACARLGTQPITVTGKQPAPGSPPLASGGVGGVQMADVSVDIETGIVKMNKMVCVQDCGLIIDLKTAESQVYGAMIMGVAYSLFEERIMDNRTGQMLNANMEFYRLGGIGDVGEMQVHFLTGAGHDERGPVGLGEPPTVSPGAAISNAVANAIGVRVPTLPITPERVLAALEKKGGSSAKL